MTQDILITHFAKTTRDMWELGWAEANGGNVSLRLNQEQNAAFAGLQSQAEWIPLSVAAPALQGERFIFTGTGRYLRNVELAPERNIGLIELNKDGTAYRILWGFEPDGRPTSELAAHLLSHAAIMDSTNDYAHAVIHTHTPAIIALTYACDDLSTAKLTALLWRMHAECVVVFPKGVEFLPWMMAGSNALGHATADALRTRTLVVWEQHGIVGTGRNLDEAFGRIHVAEKAAGIYLACAAAGGVKKVLRDAQIQAIADNFKCNWEESLLLGWRGGE
jgi:rhamnulose-1-phosphate aldolase